MVKRKPVRDTYIFTQMNKGGYIDNILKVFMNPNSAIDVTPKMLEEQLIRINKTFKYPAKLAVLEAFKNGQMKLMMLNPTVRDVKLPVSIPFLFNKERTSAIVFIDNYARFNKKLPDTIDMDYKKLYCLMESAYLALEGYNPANTRLINVGTAIFAQMFTRILNKRFSLNTDKAAMNKVLFLASKYFLINILGMTDADKIFNYALKTCNSATAILMRDVDQAFNFGTFENISTFISGLASESYKFASGFSQLTVRDYMLEYARTYGQETLLSLESLDYFMYVISSVTMGAYLNNQVVLDDIVGDDGKKMYLEMGR
jgi:hypothetical protein